MSDIQSIIERVKRLLALSQSDNANEAAVATAKANALIDQYRLSVDQLTPDSAASDPLIQSDEPLYHAQRAMAWRKLLAVRLSRHYGCFVWNHTSQGGVCLRVAGRKSDVDILRYMFAYISSECERIGTKTCKGKGRTYAESYRSGFVDGVTAKLAESRREAARTQAQVANTSAEIALVKLDDRTREARSFVQSTTPLKNGGTIRAGRDSSAFANGQHAGRQMHLGASLGAGRTRMLNG